MCAATSSDLWTIAKSRLTPEHQSQLSVGAQNDKHQSPFQALLLLLHEKQKIAMEKRWSFKTGSGKVIFIRDLFEKIVHWVNKFVEVGNTVVTYDPTHAALPWAGVLFLLKLATSDVDIFGSIVDGIEMISRLIARCSCYEALYLAPKLEQTTQSRSLLEEALIGLYVEILTYLAQAVKYYQTRTGMRIMKGLGVPSTKFEQRLSMILQKEAELQSILQVAEGEQTMGLGGILVSVEAMSKETNSNFHSLKTMVESLGDPLTRALGHLARFEEMTVQQERLDLLRWLSNVNFREQHKTVIRDLLPGTGEWLFNRPEYQQWQYSSFSSVLWLRGIPGCGKSKLFSLVVERYISRSQNVNINTAPIAYFYCSKTNNYSTSDPRTVMCNILKQLSCQKDGKGIHQTVFAEYDRRKRDANSDGVDVPPLTLEQCSELIIAVASDYPIQIFIDGIDEMDDSRELLEFLNYVVQGSSNVVKIFISSRDEVDLELWLNDPLSLNITSLDNSQDIAKFVNKTVETAIKTKKLLKGHVSSDLKQRIVSRLCIDSGPMFLWASLHLAQLCDRNKYKLENDVLGALGTLPLGLKRTFDQIYQNINAYPQQAKQATKSVFAWLLVCQRPLSKQELVEAVSGRSTEDDGNSFNLELSEGHILDLCSSFLQHQPSSQHFAFSHASILEYLQSLPEYSSSTINYIAAARCLNELIHDGHNANPFDEGNSHTGDALMQSNFTGCSFSFGQYAASYWARHYSMVSNDTEIQLLRQDLLKFVFDNAGTIFEYWIDQVQKLVDTNPGNLFALTIELAAAISEMKSPIFVASVYGIMPIFENIAQHDAGLDWNAQKSNGASAIYITARFGQLEAMQYLIGKGVRVNIQGGILGNPGQAAAFYGNTDALHLLARHGLDLLAPGHFPSVYHAAILGNQEASMRLLLQEPWREEIPDVDDLLALGAQYGHREVVEWLLQYKEALQSSGSSSASIRTSEKKGKSQSDFPHDTLQTALYSGRPGSDVAMKLLKRMGDVNDEGGSFGNALCAASVGGYLPFVRRLLEYGADANSTGRYGSALRAACLGGHDDVVRLLLEHGARSGLSRQRPYDCLEAAASRNHLSTLELLVDYFPISIEHSSTNSVDHDNTSIGSPLEPALRSACRHGHIDIVRYLLANGAQASAARVFDDARVSGQKEVIEALIDTLKGTPDYESHTARGRYRSGYN